MRFNILVVQREKPAYVHTNCFKDVGLLLRYGLDDLGAQVVSHHSPRNDCINIILGYHLLKGRRLPEGYRYIVYQLEELMEHGGWPAEILETLRSPGCAVWDYARHNIDFLAERGISAIQKPFGFHPKMCRVVHNATKDVDILFYGSASERRLKLLTELEQKFKTQRLCGVYGKERDAWIGRSKIVLSVCYGDVKFFDEVRASYLMNNRVFNITEDSRHRKYEDLLVYAPYEEIIEACEYYLDQDDLRSRKAEHAFEKFSEYPESEFLRKALNQTWGLITPAHG